MATTNGTTKAKTAAKKTAASIEKSTEEAVKAGTEAFTENFEKVFGASQERFDTAMKSFSDLSSYNQENMDALAAAGTTFAKGMEAVSAEMMAISKRNMEDSVAAMKALTGVKSAKEYFEVQSDLVKTAWDNMVIDSGKISEMTREYSKEAFTPLNSRMSEAMERMSKPATL